MPSLTPTSKPDSLAKTAAILLSRQQLQPTSTQKWIISASEAIKWAGDNDLTLLTSTGMQTWELLIYLAKIHGVRQKIVVPSIDWDNFSKQCSWIENQFDLHENGAEFIPLLSNDSPRKSILAKRDRHIVEKADLLIPVSIRNNGLHGKTSGGDGR